MKRIQKVLFITFILLFCAGCVYSNHSMHPLTQINYVKSKIKKKKEPYYSAYKQLIHYADSLQLVSHHALIDFSVPGYYDKPQEHRANSLALQRDAFGAYCSALAYRLSDEKKYGLKACYFMNAWSGINKKYTEHDGVLVMTYSGTAFLIAAELMSDKKIWTNSHKEEFKKWTKDVYQEAANTIRVHKNNWADWGRFGSLLAASFLNDKAEIKENIRLIKSDLFGKIAPDGSMPEEIKRGSNGIWYTYFSLAPLTASCWLVYNLTGENLFALKQDSTSIKKALDYLFYYNKHPKEWKWNENPNSGSADVWPGNLMEAMSGIYNDQSYVDYVKGSRPILYPTHNFAWTFPTLMPLTLGVYK